MIEEVPLADGITLRLAAEQDVEALVRAYDRNRDHLKRWEPRRPDEFFTADGQAKRLKGLLEDQAQGRAMAWVLADGEEIVGRATLSGIVRGPWLSADLGYWVDGGYIGRGLATGAVREVCRMADEELRLHRIAASVLLDNAASQNVLVKTGFEPYGTADRYLEIDGRWQTCRLFQRILNDRPAM